MTDINTLALVGRLTRDLELRYSTGGMAIGKFSLAFNRRKKQGDAWTDEVNYIDCTLFGKTAESLSQYLTKGKQVAIHGEIQQNRWEQDGQNRSRIEVIVNSIQLLGSRSDAQTGAPAAVAAQPASGVPPNPATNASVDVSPPPATNANAVPQSPTDAADGGFDDDIPF